MNVFKESDLSRISEDINTAASRVAQDVFLSRRSLILQAVNSLTGQDYTEQIPAVRKGRPAKKKD